MKQQRGSGDVQQQENKIYDLRKRNKGKKWSHETKNNDIHIMHHFEQKLSFFNKKLEIFYSKYLFALT